MTAYERAVNRATNAWGRSNVVLQSYPRKEATSVEKTKELVYEVRVRFDPRNFRVRDVDFDTQMILGGLKDGSIVMQEGDLGKVTVKRVKR